MKSLRTTLFIVFTGLSLVISFGVGMIIYAQYSAYIKDTYEGTLKQVLEGVAEYFPLLSDTETLIREGQEQSDVYTNLCIELQKIAKIVNVEDFAVLEWQQANTYRFLVAVFQEGDPLLIFNEGLFLAPYEPEEEAARVMETVASTKTFQITPAYTDEYGTHVSGSFPLIKDGSVVGILGVDYAVSYVDALHQRAYFGLIVSMILGGVLASVGAYVLATFLVRPINHVTLAARELAQAHFDIQIPITTKNEIGGQQQALCTIRDNLKNLVSTLNNQVNLQVQKIVFNKIVGDMRNVCTSKRKEKLLKKWRAGIEAVISNLKRGFDIARCTWKGWKHYRQKVFLSVIGYNIRVMTAVVIAANFIDRH